MSTRSRFNIDHGYTRGPIVVLKFKDNAAAGKFMAWIDGDGKKKKDDLGWE